MSHDEGQQLLLCLPHRQLIKQHDNHIPSRTKTMKTWCQTSTSHRRRSLKHHQLNKCLSKGLKTVPSDKHAADEWLRTLPGTTKAYRKGAWASWHGKYWLARTKGRMCRQHPHNMPFKKPWKTPLPSPLPVTQTSSTGTKR